jgi:hypothetical protein
VREPLAAEYLDGRNAQAALAKALEGPQQAHGGLRDAMAARIVLWPCQPSVTRGVVGEPRCTACDGADVPDTTAKLNADRTAPTIPPAGAPMVVAYSAKHAASLAAWTISQPRWTRVRYCRMVGVSWQKKVALNLLLVFAAEPAGEDIRGTSRDSQAVQPIRISHPVPSNIERCDRTA